MKEKKPKSDSKDEGSYSADEGSNSKKKGNKKGRLKCTYCNKTSHNEKSCFKKKLDIMTQLLERNNIDVPDFERREKSIDPQEHCHTMQFKGNDCHALVSIVKYFPSVSNFDIQSYISE